MERIEVEKSCRTFGSVWTLAGNASIFATMRPSFASLLVLFSFASSTAGKALAWGEPHRAITRAALEVLPTWQVDALGAEFAALGDNYCLIPDNVFTDKANAKFATMDIHPGEVYLKRLHLPSPEQAENLITVQYFVNKAVVALREGKMGDAARYMGTLCHLIEDFGSPSHTIPGDNMFTLLQQFMPPSEIMKGKLLHGPIENGNFKVSISGYQPQLLGASVEEVSWHLLHRIHDGIIRARSTTIPIIQALYANDAATVLKHQMIAAESDARIVADAVHSFLCLGSGRFDEEALAQLQTCPICAFWPVEAVNLYYPQSEFFSSPFWGHAHSGEVLEGGAKAVPIRLSVATEEGSIEKSFPRGISPGMGKPLTWHLPPSVYRRFTSLVGLQLELGQKGRVEFTVLGDGKSLATVTLNGTDPAHEFDCDITGVKLLRLSTISRGLDPKSNYAVWADPQLVKTQE